MTQLDIPPISFARYLDLLKRRRWHVIPISLLGLIVGAAVAFFIPRYYVSVTTIKYSGSVLETAEGTPDDPMLGVVAGASLTIPATIPDAIEQLGWPEYVNADQEGKRFIVSATRSQFFVRDLNVDMRGRSYASLSLTYRDTDPNRVAAFPNTLRDLWIRERESDLKGQADRERAETSRRLREADQDLSNARQELRLYQEQNEINPAEGANGERSESARLSEQVDAVEQRIIALEAQEQRLAAQAAQYEAALGTLPKQVPDPTRENPVLLQAIQLAAQEIIVATAALQRITAAHNSHSLRTQQVETARARLEELEAQRVAESQKQGNLVDNPVHARLNADKALAEAELAGVRKQLEIQRANLATLDERLRRLPAIWEGYQQRLSKIDIAVDAVRSLTAQQSMQTQAYQRIVTQEPIEVLRQATVTPRPTEPNTTLLALAGSAVGLGLAIGLILLIDVARTTFKTVDDVERTLDIPVLGSMAHLETTEQRRETSSKRRSAALVAGAFLVLLVTTVTIYYTDPVRLPAFARNLLELLLGSTS